MMNMHTMCCVATMCVTEALVCRFSREQNKISLRSYYTDDGNDVELTLSSSSSSSSSFFFLFLSSFVSSISFAHFVRGAINVD